MNPRAQLGEHLRFFEEMGVSGVSRDASWRAREAEHGVVEGAEAPASPGAGASFLQQPDLLAEPVETLPEVRARSSAEALQLIRDDLGDCTRCKLHRLGRRQIVYGVGSPDAELMFVGEAPGRDEDLQGIPFVGRAGQLLTKMIEAIGLTRDEVYIANVIKCRPPENRSPEPGETATCEPFLFRQLDAIKPKVVVALGAVAVKALLKSDAPISRIRGSVIPYRGARLVPTFHPAFLLRSPDKKREAWEDLKKVLALLRGDE